jgi:hypothetical protein
MTDEQYAALMAVLLDIRHALFAGIEAVGEEAEPDDETCQHPDTLRVDLSGFHDPDHWVCSVCRFEHKGLTRN